MAFMLIYPTDNTDTNTSTRTEFWLSGLPGMKTCRALYQKMGSVDSSSYLITAAAIYLDCATQDLSETKLVLCYNLQCRIAYTEGRDHALEQL